MEYISAYFLFSVWIDSSNSSIIDITTTKNRATMQHIKLWFSQDHYYDEYITFLYFPIYCENDLAVAALSYTHHTTPHCIAEHHTEPQHTAHTYTCTHTHTHITEEKGTERNGT